MAVLQQAIRNLDYSDDYYSYLTKKGVDSVHNLDLIIQSGWFRELDFVPFCHWLAIQEEAKNIINADNSVSDKTEIDESQNLKKTKTKRNTKEKSKRKKQRNIPWTKREEDRVHSIIFKQPNQNKLDWDEITKEFNEGNTTKRSKKAIRQKYFESINDDETDSETNSDFEGDTENDSNSIKENNKAGARWDPDENKKLKRLVAKHGGTRNINWSKIAQKLGTERTAKAVAFQYRKQDKTRNRKQCVSWTKSEEEKLMRIVNKSADKSGNNWKQIAIEFNANNETKRTKDALRIKHAELKKSKQQSRRKKAKLQKTRVKDLHSFISYLINLFFN